MSSAGVISGTKSGAITAAGESSRKADLASGAGPSQGIVGPKRGIVRDKDPKGLRVKATTIQGEEINGGQWITLSYTADTFVETFGDIELGDVVDVNVINVHGKANAIIVGRSGEEPEYAIKLENKVKMGVGAFLFPPGIGVG